MPRNRVRITSLIVWILATLVTVTCLVTPFLSGPHSIGSTASDITANLIFLAVAPVYAITAAVVVSRVPRHPVGWLMLTVGVGVAVGVGLEAVVPTSLLDLSAPPQNPGPWFLIFVMFVNVAWAFFVLPIVHLLLTFPTGRLLSVRWRALAVLEVLTLGYLVFLTVFSGEVGPVDGEWTIANPIGFLGEDAFNGSLFAAALAVLALGGLGALVLRFIRSTGVERQQMKLLLLGTAGFAFAYVISWFEPESNGNAVFNILFGLSLIGIGLSIALAILRYRLYEIDRVISRTVGYVLVVGALGLIYAAGTVWLPSLFFGSQAPPVFVAGSTLAVAALFNPLRRRVQRVVDRRFNRSRYDAERVIAQFTDSLRQAIDSDELLDGWLGIASKTMQPRAIGVWMRS